MSDNAASRLRAEKARVRFDGQASAEQSEARKISRLRAQETRQRDRLRKFRERWGSDPCYAHKCVQPSVGEGLCRSHLTRLMSSPYVDGPAFTAIVLEWAERWKRDHEQNRAHAESEIADALTVREVLIERVGRVVKSSPVTAAAIDTVLNGERRRVEFYELADPIAQAIGQPFVFSEITGSLPVLGEPLSFNEEEAA